MSRSQLSNWVRNSVSKRWSPDKQQSLSQHHEVLMPVQLPDDFVVPGARPVEIRNAAEIDGAGFDPGEIVAAPVDSGARFNLDTEKRESVGENLFGKGQDFGFERGATEALGDQIGSWQQGEGRGLLRFEARGMDRHSQIGELLSEAEPELLRRSHRQTPFTSVRNNLTAI